MTNMIEFPWRAKVRAGANSTSTNGFVYRYFLLHSEACRCPGRVGPPEYAPGHAKGERPKWLQDAYEAWLATNG